MFEYVQEREVAKRLESRTLVYVITTGESDGFGSQNLSDRGENQIIEMARSRVATGVRILYSATNKLAAKSADMLGNEFESKVKKIDCLDSVNFGNDFDNLDLLADKLKKMWQDENYAIENGESFSEARERFGTCMGGIIAKHQDDVLAVVVDPLMAILFHALVTAAPLDIEDWHSIGNAACATYEYSRGWNVVMPSDNSYLSDPTFVKDNLPDELL